MSSWVILVSLCLVGLHFLDFLRMFWAQIWSGRLGHQKRIRKLIRMLTFSAGIHIVVWEECYWRWRALNESINNIESSTAVDGADSSQSHSQQARFSAFIIF